MVVLLCGQTFWQRMSPLLFIREIKHRSRMQSGVSHIISALEEDLGLSLLYCSRSGARPTYAGERLLPYIRQLIQDDEQIR